MEFEIEPDTIASRFISKIAKSLIPVEYNILICYDLTWGDPGIWLSKLNNAGFSVIVQPYQGTGRQLAICNGVRKYIDNIDLFDPVWPSDSTFLHAYPKYNTRTVNSIESIDPADIFRLAVKEPDNLWTVLGDGGLFVFIGGDEYEFIVVLTRNIDSTQIVQSLISVSTELGFLLYDAGSINGWGNEEFLLVDDYAMDREWHVLPKHWHRVFLDPDTIQRHRI